MPFFCIRISQGSVATCLKRDGIFNHDFVAHLLSSRLVKKIWKSDNSYWSYRQEFGVLFFWLTVYIYHWIWYLYFLPRDAMLARYVLWLRQRIRPSFSLSGATRSSLKTSKRVLSCIICLQGPFWSSGCIMCCRIDSPIAVRLRGVQHPESTDAELGSQKRRPRY